MTDFTVVLHDDSFSLLSESEDSYYVRSNTDPDCFFGPFSSLNYAYSVYVGAGYLSNYLHDKGVI